MFHKEMRTNLKRHEKVRLLAEPEKEYIEYYAEPPVEIKKGAVGEINIILPNGKYHVKITNEKNETIAYVVMEEEFLEKLE